MISDGMLDFYEIYSGILFALTIAYSFYGYGSFISKKIDCVAQTAIARNAGLKILLGFSLFIWLSGFVELFQIGGKYLYLGFLSIGTLYATYLFFKNTDYVFLLLDKFRSNYRLLLLTITVITTVSALLINLAVFQFNTADDYQGYLVFSMRLLAEGYQGFDPFSTRLVEQGFGAGNSINALFLSIQPPKYLHLAEGGVGVVMLTFIMLNQFLENKDKVGQLILKLLLVYALVIFSPIVNISPLISGCAMMLGTLIFVSTMPPSKSYGFAVILGFFLASFLSLKGTFLAPAFVVGASLYLSRLIFIRKSWVISEGVLTLISFLFFLLPWLISNYVYHNTAFYPLLGKGFSTSGSFGIVGAAQFFNSISEYLPLYGLLIISYTLLASQQLEKTFKVFATTLAVIVVLVTMILALTPGGFFRYTYILLSCPIVFFFNKLLSLGSYSYRPNIRVHGFQPNKYIVLTLLFSTVLLMTHQIKRNTRIFFGYGIFASHDVLPAKSRVSNYSELQNSLPVGAQLLTVTTHPYLHDFKRNKIFAMDYPGNAGPHPGVPFQESHNELAKYLSSNDIRYVAHSYVEAINLKKNVDLKLAERSEDLWMKNLVLRNHLVNEQLLLFKDDFRTIFDDGQIRVFDICQPTSGSPNICNMKNLMQN